jgi:hypothetical protein
MPVIPAIQEPEIRRISIPSEPRQIVGETLSQKNPSQKRAGGVVQIVALNSSPSTATKGKKKKKGNADSKAYYHLW